jgi:hypothetical protein
MCPAGEQTRNLITFPPVEYININVIFNHISIIFIELIEEKRSFSSTIVKHLSDRFPDDIKPMLYGFYLLPWYFRNLTDDIVGSLVDEYQNDIPYPDVDFYTRLKIMTINKYKCDF